MARLKRLLFRPPVELAEPRPHKLEEREKKDQLIEEEVKANSKKRKHIAKIAEKQTLRYHRSLSRAMAILGED